MNYTQEEQFEIQGFRNGYFIASKAKTLQHLILNLHHHPAYVRGLEKGIEQYEKDRELISPTLSILEQRRTKLKQITEREQDRDIGDFER